MQEIMSKKGHEKTTMIKKVTRLFGGENDRMIEVKSTTSKKGHQNFRCKNYKSSRVTELCHFFNPNLTTADGCQISSRTAGMYVRYACIHLKGWMNEALVTNWLHSSAVCMAENNRPVYYVHPQLLHAQFGEKRMQYNPSFTVDAHYATGLMTTSNFHLHSDCYHNVNICLLYTSPSPRDS